MKGSVLETPGRLVVGLLTLLFLGVFSSSLPILPAAAVFADEAASLQTSAFFKPIGEWTGQIFLPLIEWRKPDGAVPFMVFTSPVPGLAGHIIPLRWKPDGPNAWFEQARVDIRMDPKRVKKNLEAHNKLPRAIDGWKRVSPLESIPANREVGSVEVLLKSPEVRDGSLWIDSEPVQINGSHYCLARFEGPAEGNQRRIVHFNPGTGAFDGPSQTVQILHEFKAQPNDSVPVSRTANGIERSEFNRQGWYMYGKWIRGAFLVKALEPRILLRVAPTRAAVGKKGVESYLDNVLFDNMQRDMYRASYLDPRNVADPGNSLTALQQAAEQTFPAGARGLVLHLFGWRKAKGEKANIMGALDLYPGHFSFGTATVVRCPFTGERRFDIDYQQVYGHNREEVVSGAIKWHAYMGNLRRGWMYSIPVWDTIMLLPELYPYEIAGRRYDPMRGLMRELERMTALYRVGGGTGISEVGPSVSCVQDSHCALYAGLRNFTDRLSRQDFIQQWVAQKTSSDPEVRRWLRLAELVMALEHTITGFGIPQRNWREFSSSPLGVRDPQDSKPLLEALVSAKTVFPRRATEQFLRLAARRGTVMYTILSVMVGGTITDIEPQAPTTLLIH